MRRVLDWLPTAAGTYAIVGGTLTVLGWALDLRRLADWGDTGITMQPNTAICAILIGMALLLVARRRTIAGVLGLLVAGIGAVTLLEHAIDYPLGIDSLFLFGRTWGGRATVFPGRMGVPAATSWVLAGVAFLMLLRDKPTPAIVPANGLAMTCISGLSIIGYLLGADPLFTLPRLTAISFPTATILFAIGVGLISIAPDCVPVRILMGDSAGSVLARRTFPILIMTPVLLGYLCVLGQNAGLYDASMAISLLVLSLVLILCTLFFGGVRALIMREESLRGSEERFSQFMEHLPGLAWIKDAEGRYLYANEAAEKVFGYRRDELNGKTDSEVFPAETAAQFRKNDREALFADQGVQIVETLRHDDGVVHHSIVSKFPIAVRSNAAPLIGGIAIDITDRKRAEEAVSVLLRIGRHLNSTLSVNGLLDILVTESMTLVGAQDGLAGLMTPAGMVANRYFQNGQARPFEYCWPPMHGLPGWLIVHKAPYLTNDARSDPQFVPELRERFDVRSAISIPIITAQGEVLGFFEIHNKTDGTGFTSSDQEFLVAMAQSAAIAVQNALAFQSLQRAEESLKQSDRRKDEFLAILAHELRNPLAPIRSGLEIIKLANGNVGLIRDAEQAMERQVTHMVRLVDDLLDLSRITHDKLQLRKQRVELTPVIEQAIETCRSIADREGQSITFHPPQEVIELDADPVRLSQVFGNLLNNACKFSPSGGEIVISTVCDRNVVMISIKDHGIGIPTEKLGQVFEMFMQVHQSVDRPHGGLGIGLTLVRRLVEMHSGSIQALSDGEGRGSEFQVRLPRISSTQSGSAVDNHESSNGSGRSRKVLIVDDNRDAGKTLSFLVELMGHEIAIAHDGIEACEVAETFRPEVILLDIGLPRMNGYDACRAIRKTPSGQNTVIIALTGWGQHQDRQRSVESGFDAHCVKPVNEQVLRELLSKTRAELKPT